MPDNITLYILLVIALGIGYLLGRRERRTRSQNLGMVAEDYFKGLNHLLNERHDQAIDTFVERMAVDSATVDTHLALGSLVRRRGEVDRAIRIHQNLLARPVLSAAHRSQTELELARDYLVAGLLHRAEKLLLELASKAGPGKPVAQELLVEVYQRERDWEKAVSVGRDLARADRDIRGTLAHFQCEIAQQALEAGDLPSARKALDKAMGFDGQSARVCLIGAGVEFQAHRYRDVRRLLRKACQYDSRLAAETFEMFRAASLELNDEAGYFSFLEERLVEAPVLAAIEALGIRMAGTSGHESAHAFMVEQLLRNPTLSGFVSLLKHLDTHGEPLPAEQLALVRRFSEALLQKQPAYRCSNCGFSGQSLMWQCPSCRCWDSIRPVTGLAQLPKEN